MDRFLSLRDRILWLVAFSIAMGFLETAVVVYLRLLYYPNGFQFPLVVMSPEVGLVEILREAATIVMLLGVSVLAGADLRQRFAFFLMVFAVWDIFYYVFLKLILNWPSSVFTWDILFLTPAPWVGPVLSPLLVCCLLLMLSSIILKKEFSGNPQRLDWLSWAMIVSGSMVVIFSWMWDYIRHSGRITDSPEKALESLVIYVPSEFNWWIFIAGMLMILTGIAVYWRKSRAVIS